MKNILQLTWLVGNFTNSVIIDSRDHGIVVSYKCSSFDLTFEIPFALNNPSSSLRRKIEEDYPQLNKKRLVLIG